MAAIAGDEHLATVLVGTAGKATELALLERTGLVLTASLLFERSLRDAQYRLQRELIDELLAPRIEISDALKERARRFGITGAAPLIVRVVGVAGDQRVRALTVLRKDAYLRPSVIAIHGGFVCIVEPVLTGPLDGEPAGRGAGHRIVALLAAEGISSNVGFSSPTGKLGDLADGFMEAQSVLRALIALDRCGEAADRAALGTVGMLLASTDSTFATGLLEAQLGALMRYDNRRDTQLVETAWVYLDSDSSNSAASARLHIHPNTLRQRLDRIDSVLGNQWRRGSHALDTQVALQIWRMRSRGIGVADN